jgi:3',5'-cyclic AMP phosphodiesterase CpdA
VVARQGAPQTTLLVSRRHGYLDSIKVLPLVLLATALCGTGCATAQSTSRSLQSGHSVLATWAQITDAHVVDEESPARLEMLDRLGPPFTGAFRPQEALSGQALAAVVAAINRLRPDAVVVTGDLIDNAQANELAEALAVIRGGRVDPNSGRPGYAGVQAASNPDPFYYRPDVDPPRHSGLLKRAEQPFDSPGLRAPWYPVVGNHDLLVQGNLAPTPRTEAVATGNRKLVSLDRYALALARRLRLTPATVNAALAGGLPGRTRRVPPDPTRREPTAAEVLARLRAASGHGGRGPLLDYSFALGRRVRGIVLDTIRRTAGASGLVRPQQLAWLRRELRRAGSRWVVVFSHTPLTSCAGGVEALRLLLGDRHVVAAVAGDTHRNSVERRGRLTVITTSSLADWPQQARMFRLSSRPGGGAVLETWTINPVPTRLARISHQLAYLDYQGGRPAGDAGTRADRRARILIPPAAR